MKKIYVSLSTFAQHGREPLELLEKSGFDFELNTSGQRIHKEELITRCLEYHGIVAGVEPYDEEVLNALSNLECISRCGVGTDSIDHGIAKKKGVAIKNTPDVVIQPVAELTVAMIFDLLRKLSWHTSRLKSKVWEKASGVLLQGKMVGVIGVGRIGKRVINFLQSLGAHVIATDVYPDIEWAKQNNVDFVSLEDVLIRSDIVTLHLSCLKGNSFCLREKELALMKKGSFLINVSRGDMIDEDALYNALINNHLGGAALDVFLQEPYSGKLCTLDNIVMTPHVATLTKESRLQMEIDSVNNLLGYFNGNN